MGGEMKHVHHDIIIEWVKDTNRVIQRRESEVDPWQDEPYPHFFKHVFYRFKPAEPKYIIVNGIQVPEPVRKPLKARQSYWLADCASGKPCQLNWHDDSHTDAGLTRGLIHLTEQAAQAHIDAMLLPSRNDK